MPENDMGTAHGRVRIDYDSRGSDKATLALERLEKQFQVMNSRLEKIQAALEDVDTAADRASSSIDRVSRSTKSFNGNIFTAHRSVKAFATDIRGLANDVNKFQNAMDGLANMARPFILGYKAIDQFKQSTKAANGTLSSMSTAFFKSGTAAAMFNKQVGLNRIGLRAAMHEMPMWSQNLNRYASFAGKATIAIAGLNAVHKSGVITKYTTALTAMVGAVEKTGVISKYLHSFANTGPISTMLSLLNRAGKDVDAFGKRIEKLPTTFAKMLRPIDDFGKQVESLPMKFAKGLKPIADFGTNVRGFVTGLALLKSGIGEVAQRFAWLGKIPTPIMYALQTSIARVLPAALGVLGRALTATSNLAAGLWDGIKTLSGGLLILPGLFASIAAGASTLMIAFAGVGKNLKDAFSSDPKKAAEAYMALSPAMQGLVDSIKNFAPAFKELQESLQGVALKGLSDQINQLGNTYMPLFARSMIPVMAALRGVKDQLVGFLLESQTQKDISRLYTTTAESIHNMGLAIRPALEGLRNIGTVGADFVATMSTGLPRLTNQFAQWAQTARQTGQLQIWMMNAREGVIRLTAGTRDLAKGLYSILTMFQTSSQSNFLERYAASMQKFSTAMQKSAGSGMLRKIGDEVRSWSTIKLDNFRQIASSLNQFISSVLPIINSIAQAFSGPFVFAMRQALHELSLIAQAFHALGLDSIIGTIWGMTAAWSAFSNLMVPLTAKARIFVGAFMALKNVVPAIQSVQAATGTLAVAMENLGGRVGRAGASLGRVAPVIGGALTKIASAVPQVAAVAAVLGGLFYLFKSGQTASREWAKQMDQNAQVLDKFGTSLRKAFQEDQGQLGHTVISEVDKGLQDELRQLDETAKKTPGVMAHVRDFFISNHGFNFNDSDSTNQMQAQGDAAKHAAEQLRQLQDSGEDLNKVITGSQEGFDSYVQHLDAIGKNPAADALRDLRAQFNTASHDAETLGVGGEMAAQGIDKLATAAGNASTKLDGLKLMLQGLGLLKTNTIQAVAEYNEAIENLVVNTQKAIEDAGDGSSAWNAQAQALDENTKAGRAVIAVWGQASQQFLATASAGGNVDEMVARLNSQMGDLANTVGADPEQLKNYFATSLGVNPIVKIGVELGDVKDKVAQDFGRLMIALQAQANNGVAVKVNFDTPQAAQDFITQIRKNLGDAAANAFNVDGGVVTRNSNVLPPDLMNNLTNYLNTHGFKGLENPVGPVKAFGVGPDAPNLVQPPQTAPAPDFAYGQRPAPPPGSSLSGSQALSDQLSRQAGQQPVDTGTISTIPDKLSRDIDTDPAQQTGIDTSQSVVDTATEILEKGGAVAGQKFVDSLAGGLGQNDKADFAAGQLADDVLSNFHQSPPKKGPLAAHGDAAKYGGRQFVAAYAAGMRGQAPSAADAAAAIGAAAAGGVSTPGAGMGAGIQKAGEMFGDLQRLSDFVSHVVNAFRGSFEAVTGLMKWASDPMKKGTFFGMSPGEAFGFVPQYGEETARKMYEDRMAQQGMSSAGSATRFGMDNWDAQTGFMKGAPGTLAVGAPKEEVVGAIVRQGRAAGLTDGQITAMIATANIESNFGQNVNGGIQAAPGSAGTESDRVLGLFQEKASFGSVEERMDPNGAIKRFIDRYSAQLKNTNDPVLAATLAQNPQLGSGAKGSDYYKTITNALAPSLKDLRSAASSGAGTPMTQGFAPGTGPLGPGIPALKDTGSIPSQEAARFTAGLVAQQFPFITNIGGSRDSGTAPNTHDKGRAIDIMLGPNYKDPAVIQQGRDIQNFLMANKDALGIVYTIFQQQGVNADGSTFDMSKGDDDARHLTHIDVQFKEGFKPSGQGLQFPIGGRNYMPTNALGAPNLPGTPGYRGAGTPQQYVRDPNTGKLEAISTQYPGAALPEALKPTTKVNSDNGLEVYDSSGNLLTTIASTITEPTPVKDASGRVLGIAQPGEHAGIAPTLGAPESWNPLTRLPYTPEDRAEWDKQHPLQYSLDPNAPSQDIEFLRNHPEYLRSKEEVEDGMKAATPGLAEAMQQAYMGSQSERASALQRLSGMQQRLMDVDTVEARQQSALIGSTISDAASQAGLTQGPNPIDSMSSAASAISGTVQAVFSTISSVIETVGAAEDLTSMSVRGMSNTEDVNKAIDDVQKFIELGANIAGVVANAAGAAGSIASAVGSSNPMGGSGGASAALEAVSAIAGGVQATLQTINGIIDLAQEAYHIWGSYYGQFQGLLAGGPEGMLTGNVKYLLDEQSKQLLAWSSDNPADKRAHDFAFQTGNPNVRNQLAGNIIVYGGPGTDPRDDTRQMMFQVRQATMGQAVVMP